MKLYEHTQIGYVVIVAMLAGMAISGVAMFIGGANWVAVMVMVVVGVALVMFSSLTVTIREDEMEVRFGPGPIRRRIKLRDIRSARIVKNPFFYGWGIRLTPHGWLWNVSGFHAVELQLTCRTGQKFRIGTDVPRQLEEAIRNAAQMPDR